MPEQLKRRRFTTTGNRFRLAAIAGLFTLGGVFLLAVAGCREQARSPSSVSSGDETAVIARVGTRTISTEAFQKELARREQTTGKRLNTTADLETVLEEMIRFETLYVQAQAAGYERDAEMQERFRRLVVAKYQEDHGPERENEPLPKEAELEAYYQQHVEDFRQPKQVRVAMIFQKLSAKAEVEKQAEALQRTEKVREAALGTATARTEFGELARLHSDDAATRYQGGDCGWVPAGQTAYAWPEPVVEAMFALARPGDVSPVVRASDGLYLLKLLEARDSTPLPLAKVRDRIAWQLRNQAVAARQKQFHEEQRAGVDVTVNREELNRLVVHASSLAREVSVPPALPRP
jgi:peptidyl-prolyl cis-trans isomerase C